MQDSLVAELDRVVDRLVAQDPHGIADPALLLSTETLLRVSDRISGVLAARLQVMDVRDVTVGECGRTTRGWLVEELHLSQQAATDRLAVARLLPAHPAIGEALSAGRINHDHAKVIGICLRTVDPQLRDVVEKELLKAAEACDPTTLGKFCREIRHRYGDTETAEAAEQRKYASRWLRATTTFEGMTRIDGMVDPASAAIIEAALNPLARKAGTVDDRTSAQRLADALVTVCELSLAGGTLPETGGEKPHVIATLSYSDLAAQLEASPIWAMLGNHEVSVSTIRQLACDAQIIPVILGANGEVLDLGRKTPVWSAAQRRALRIEDGGCRFPDCQATLDQCQVHHEQHWTHGGQTNHDNGIHLCRFHHWLVHHTNWRIHKDAVNRIAVWRT